MPQNSISLEIERETQFFLQKLKEDFPANSRDKNNDLAWELVNKRFYKDNKGEWHPKNRMSAELSLASFYALHKIPEINLNYEFEKGSDFYVLASAGLVEPFEFDRKGLSEKNLGFALSNKDNDFLYIESYLVTSLPFVNANKDYFYADHLKAVIEQGQFSPSQPAIVDLDHDFNTYGFTIKAEVVDNNIIGLGNVSQLRIYDVFLAWRYPELAEKLKEWHGQGMLARSMACRAQTHECSICHSKYDYPNNKPEFYCAHLKEKKANRGLLFPKFRTASLISPSKQPADWRAMVSNIASTDGKKEVRPYLVLAEFPTPVTYEGSKLIDEFRNSIYDYMRLLDSSVENVAKVVMTDAEVLVTDLFNIYKERILELFDKFVKDLKSVEGISFADLHPNPMPEKENPLDKKWNELNNVFLRMRSVFWDIMYSDKSNKRNLIASVFDDGLADWLRIWGEIKQVMVDAQAFEDDRNWTINEVAEVIFTEKVEGEYFDLAKKLSTEQRKNLPKTAFCGPGRSFPVNDKAHYLAALRLLGRAKVSESTKAKIRACIISKGKANGWDSDQGQTTKLPNNSMEGTKMEEKIKELQTQIGEKDALLKSAYEKLQKFEEAEKAGELNKIKADVEAKTAEVTKLQGELKLAQDSLSEANKQIEEKEKVITSFKTKEKEAVEKSVKEKNKTRGERIDKIVAWDEKDKEFAKQQNLLSTAEDGTIKGSSDEDFDKFMVLHEKVAGLDYTKASSQVPQNPQMTEDGVIAGDKKIRKEFSKDKK